MSAKKRGHRKGKKTSGQEKRTADGGGFYRPFADSPAVDAARAPAAHEQASRPATQSKPIPSKPRPPDDDPDELLTFERLMSGVVPLNDDRAARVPAVGQPSKTRLTKEARAQWAIREQELERKARAKLHALVDEGSRFDVVEDGRRIDGRRRGVDGKLVHRMRRGELPIDATLDLHGLHLDQARAAVEEFVRTRRAKGDRVLLLIVGRGHNSPGGQPVLRGEVAAWLHEGKASKHVLAFSTAPSEHGGEGALCVLLANAGR